jgi:hypothetical protein
MLRGKVDLTINNRDGDGNVTSVASSQTLTPVRPGASINESKTINDAGLTVDVDYPGSLKDGDIVWIWDTSAGSMSSSSFQLNGDPSYNTANDDWTITFDTGVTSTSVSPGDRLILDTSSAHRISTWAAEVGTTAAGTLNQVTTDADGRVEFYTDVPSMDIWIDETSSLFRVLTGVKPTFRGAINVKEFGAVGDNSTDNTLAFQKALNMIEAQESGALYVPTGLYRVSGSLSISLANTPDFMIYGDGPESGGSRIQHADDASSPLLTIDGWPASGSATRSFTMRDLGFGVYDAAGAAATPGAILVKNAARAVLDNIYIFGFANAGGTAYGLKFDAEDGKHGDLNRLVNSYIGGCDYGLINDCQSSSTADYNNALFVSDCIFGSNNVRDILFENTGGTVNRGAGGHRLNNLWIQCEDTASATRGIELADDVGVVMGTNISLDGTSTGTYITIGSGCGWSFWDHISIDGKHSDASGQMYIGRMRESVTGTAAKQDHNYRRTKLQVTAATELTIDDNIDLIEVIGNAFAIEKIVTSNPEVGALGAKHGRELQVIFTNASPAGFSSAAGAVNDAIVDDLSLNVVQNQLYTLAGMSDGSVNRWYCDKNDDPLSKGSIITDYAEMYMVTPTATGTITSGTPLKIAGTVVAGDKSSDFTIADTTTGGTVTYTGSTTTLFNVQVQMAMTTSASNIVVTMWIYKNGVAEAGSEMQRKVGTGSDVGAAAFGSLVSLATNDDIEIYVDIDSGTSTLTAECLTVVLTEV